MLLLQKGSAEQIKKELKIDNVTAEKIASDPNRKNKNTIEDFKKSIPPQNYSVLEHNYRNWVAISYDNSIINDNKNFGGIQNVGGTQTINNYYNKNSEKENSSVSDKIPKTLTNNSDRKAASALDVTIESCFANKTYQTVTVNFVLTNEDGLDKLLRMAVSHLQGGSGSALDDEGNSYSIVAISLGNESKNGRYSSYIEKTLFNNTKLKASVTFANVLPKTQKLSLVNVPIFVQLMGQYGQWQSVSFTDINIVW